MKAYEILTDPKKHDNWQKYGDPDGSKAYKAMEIALPSFLLKQENQSTVLLVFFIGFICLPIILVYKKMNKSDTFFKNGLLNSNRQVLIRAIVNALIKVKL